MSSQTLTQDMIEDVAKVLQVQFGVWYRLVGASHYKKVDVYYTGKAFAVKVSRGTGVPKITDGQLTPTRTKKESLKYFTEPNRMLVHLRASIQQFHVPLEAVRY